MYTAATSSIASFSQHFKSLRDPRIARTRKHEFLEILIVAILAVICGAEGWEDMEAFGRAKETWLRTFLTLTHGIPSHDTFRRVFDALAPKQFTACFTAWVQSLAGSLDGKHVVLDGKTLRHSFDRAKGVSALHLVHAWVVGNGLAFSQYATPEGTNELTGLRELLQLLDLQGSVVSIDAMGCQSDVAETIVEKHGDYLLAVKDNQPTLAGKVVEAFEQRKDAQERTFVNKGHGRLERRTVRVLYGVDDAEVVEQWAGVRSLIMVERTTETAGKIETGRRYYICSLAGPSVQRAATLVQNHWTIENGLHWRLDVQTREDDCRVRGRNGAQNLATLRRVAVNLLTRTQTKLGGVRAKQKRAGWSNDFLLDVLRSGISTV